ncbi:MAG TPA: cytochrome C, partial [Sphingobacterium sp.]|nr:cytochrome C [Sphingobacterium sp.]
MKYIAVTLILLFSSLFSTQAQDNIDEGKALFKSRCASCHAIDKRVIGPALKDVDKRHEEKWIIDFI